MNNLWNTGYDFVKRRELTADPELAVPSVEAGMRYEPGMAIFFDVFSKSVVVSFRGKEHTLPGPYADQRTAFRAAEQFCREKGWADPQEK